MSCRTELEVIENPTIQMDMDVAVNVSGDVDVIPLSVTENGTYEEDGVAYSPVTVAVEGLVPFGTLNIH